MIIPLTKTDIIKSVVQDCFIGKYLAFAHDPYAKQNRRVTWASFNQELVSSVLWIIQERFDIDGQHYRQSSYAGIVEADVRPVVDEFMAEFHSWYKGMK